METSNSQVSQEKYQSVKPAIKTPLILLVSLGQILLFFIFLSVGIIISIAAIFQVLGIQSISFIGSLAIAHIGLLLLLWIPAYLLLRANLKMREYKFYEDHVEYVDGFLIKEKKTIPYARITNIAQRKGLVEGVFDLGTVFLETAGSSPYGNELAITYLENPDKVYDWLTTIILKKK